MTKLWVQAAWRGDRHAGRSRAGRWWPQDEPTLVEVVDAEEDPPAGSASVEPPAGAAGFVRIGRKSLKKLESDPLIDLTPAYL